MNQELHLDIYPFYYHQTRKIDEVTHRVEMGERLTGYNVTMTKNYWECENEIDVKLKLIQNLRALADELEYEMIENYSLIRK